MYTYSWDVPDRAGPSADDTACILWAYHSHVMPEFDVYAGLIGPLVICKGGVLDANNQPTDVDREVRCCLVENCPPPFFCDVS
jgi:hephaestin